MSGDESILAAIAALQEIADRVDVFAMEYENKSAAGAIFNLNEDWISRELRRHKAAGGETSGASLWRTMSEGVDPARWFVMCVDDGMSLRSRGRWGAGVPYELDDWTSRSLIERHLSRMVESSGRPLDAHGLAGGRSRFGLGAELLRGGEFRLRIGGDE